MLLDTSWSRVVFAVGERSEWRGKMGDAEELRARLMHFTPEGVMVLPNDRCGVVLVTLQVATGAAELADLVGGAVAVVKGATKGQTFGGLALTSDAVMLLGESADKHTVLRAVPVDTWLRLRAQVDNNEGAMQRAERLADRVRRRGDVTSPSAPRGAIAGNAGALINWASALACEMTRSGMLFSAVADGGLGVAMETFHVSGYLTDEGGVPAEEYQEHVLASRSRYYMEGGIEASRRGESETSADMSVERMAAATAALQIQQEPEAERNLLDQDGQYVPFPGGPAAAATDARRSTSKGSKDSKSSAASLLRKAQRAKCQVLTDGGAPLVVAQLMATLNVTLSVVTAMGAAWVSIKCAENGVVLTESERMQLLVMFPANTPATSSVGNTNVPLFQQRPENPKTPAAPPDTVFYYFPCRTANCKCKASFNGGPGRACCLMCRDNKPCMLPTDNNHEYPIQLPMGVFGVPMPTSKKAMAEAYCALPHTTSKQTPMERKHSKLELETKLWDANFYACAPCVRDAYKTAADESRAGEEEGDEGDGASNNGFMPRLVSNSSTAHASDNDEIVEVTVPATAPQTLFAARPVRQAQARTAERAARDQAKALERASAAEVERERVADVERARAADDELQQLRAIGMLSAREEDDGMTQRTRRDAEEILRVSEFVRGDILTCIEGVEPKKLRTVITCVAAMFEGSKEAAKLDWIADAMLPHINQQIALAATAMATSLEAQILLQPNAGTPEAQLSRVFMALTAMAGATSSLRSAVSGGSRTMSSSDARINEAVMAAAERLGAPGAASTLAGLQRMAVAAARRQLEAGPALRAGVAAAVQHEAYGADISLLLHQEKLDTPKGATVSHNASRVWALLFGVAQRLREAVTSHYRKLLPKNLDAAKLVQAVACGKLTVAEMVPAALTASKSPKAAGETRDAVLRAWPAVMAIMAELNARDKSAQSTFLKLARELFDPCHAGADPIERILKPALEEMRIHYALYLLDGGDEPSWEEMAAESEQSTISEMVMQSGYAVSAPELKEVKPAVPSQAEQQRRAAANAAANAERERMRAAAAAAGAAAGVAPKPGVSFVKDEKWAVLTWAEKRAVAKERKAAEAKEE